MKQLQVTEQNKPYYSVDYVKGFNDGAKAQYEADKKEAERTGRWLYKSELYSYCGRLFYPKICSACNGVFEYTTTYCPNCGARMEASE